MSAKHNLLYGALAMQLNLIGPDVLFEATESWKKDKKKSLRDILLDQGRLSEDQIQRIDAYFAINLEVNGDAEKSLQAISGGNRSPNWLLAIDDSDAEASVPTFSTKSRFPSTLTHNGSNGAQVEETIRDGSRYRILEFHKEGGLGRIFTAEDTELHREVALKEIRPERADEPSSRGRFVFEAEITGGLDHPGIVPVHGFGVYQDGRPYYAMRFIRGETFKDAIEKFHAAEKSKSDSGQRRMKFRQLLRRFVDACNAIAYAHSRGVLHRDIKPANIMIGPFGETLVVDWGVAKTGIGPRINQCPEATSDPILRPPSESHFPATMSGSVVGTPHYMSPEQAAGEIDNLGTASDIYSLGATLHCLLTGKKPFEEMEVAKVLKLKQNSLPPSPLMVNGKTPRPLDAICRKAMALNPAQRYQSALDLAADVEHWMADEPITAFRDPPSVRLGRWARRRRTLVVAVAVLLLSAVVALGVSTALIWKEQKRTEEQARIAKANYETALDASAYSIDMIRTNEAEYASDPRLHVTRKKMLKSAARAFREFLKQDSNEADMRSRAVWVFRYAANVHRLSNEINEAEELYREALRLTRELADEFPNDPTWRILLASIRLDHGNLKLNVGRLRDAAVDIDRSIEELEKLFDDDPTSLYLRRLLANSVLDGVRVEHLRGNREVARRNADRALALYRPLQTLPPDQYYPYDQLFLAATLNVIAVLEREVGNNDLMDIHVEACDLIEDWTTNLPKQMSKSDFLHARARFRLQRTLTSIQFSRDDRSLVRADKNLSSSIDQWLGLAQSFPDIPMFQESMAEAYFHRGLLRSRIQQAAAAKGDLENARRLFESLVENHPEMIVYLGDLGRTYLEMGRLCRGNGDKSEANQLLDKAVNALGKATELCPDNAGDQMSLSEARAEHAK